MYLYLSASSLFGTTSLSYSSVSSQTTNDLFIIVAGTYTLYAVCPDFTQVSYSITVTAGTALLAFSSQPVYSAGSYTVSIKAQDKYGNLVSSASYSVTLTIDGTTAGFTPMTSTMTAGTVQFTNCQISGAGIFRFIASTSGISPASSNSFTVSQTLQSVSITAPSGTILAGFSYSFELTLLDTNGLNFINTATITITKSSGPGTITTTGLSSFVPLVYASVSFSEYGNYDLIATCTGTNCGSFSVTTCSVTVSKNAYIDIKWPNYIQEGTTNSYSIGLLGVSIASDVTITITSSMVTINSSPLTFSSVNNYQSVSITVPYFSGLTNSQSVTISHSFATSDPNYASASYEGCGIASTGVMTLPIYTQSPTITIDSQLVVSSLGQGTYQISITVPPKTGSIIVTPSFTGSAISISPSSVTFTSSSYSAKSITVTSLTAITSISSTVTISHTVNTNSDTIYSSYISVPSNLQTIVSIIETSFAGVSFTNSYLGIAYSETGSYTFSLKTTPTSAVTVSITASPSVLTISPSSVSVTTTSAQSISVTVTSFPATVTNIEYTVTLTHTLASSDSNYNGLIYETIIDVINTCTPAVYDWTNTNTCTATISNFVTTSGVPVACNPGYYYSSGCVICPVGSYCPNGVNSVACPSGYYTTSTGQLYCTKTAAGTTFSSSSTSPISISSPGSYALPGVSSSTSCLEGDYCPLTTLNAEFKCWLGSYSSALGQKSCTTCPKGSSCTSISAGSSTCGSTNYSPAGRPECFLCSDVFTSCSSGVITLVTEGSKISSNTISSCASSSQVCSVRNNFQAISCPIGTTYASNTCTGCATGTSCNGGSSTSPCSNPSYN